ncbi:hypothetical protein ACHHYP_15229 [Achlya hypogyna]|uniref:Uncharacterized protein n=1 Tax=Achlya hypogyna TaxID=1202772 RepID=A0A1V9YBC5_ACHHY|nr:hypothetical protein ACHHYP_15229 [Achlya hypogyna]
MAKLLNRWKKRSPQQVEEDLLRERLEKLRQEQLNILSPPDERAKSGLLGLFTKEDHEPALERRRSASVTAPAFIKNAFRSTSVGNQDDSSHLEVADDEADMLAMDRRRSSSLSSSFLKNPFRSNSIPSSLPSTADEDDDLPDTNFPTEVHTPEEDPSMERRRGLSTSFLKNPFRLSSPEDTDDTSSTSSHPSALTSTLKKVSRSLSRAVSKNIDVTSHPSGRYVGENVHTAAGAGVVTEVKPDGSAVVKLCNTDVVNCSCVIVESDGEIEALSALPGDFVFTHMGPGTVLSYDPKQRTFQVEIADEIHTCSPHDIIASSEKTLDDDEDLPVDTPPKSKANVAKEFALRATKFLKPSTAPRFKYQVGQCVYTTLGDGTIVELRPLDQTYVIEFSAGAIGYLQEGSIKATLKAKVADAVVTRFGSGVVSNVVDENVFIVRVGDEDVYVHSSDLQLAKAKASTWSLLKMAPSS